MVWGKPRVSQAQKKEAQKPPLKFFIYMLSSESVHHELLYKTLLAFDDFDEVDAF